MVIVISRVSGLKNASFTALAFSTFLPAFRGGMIFKRTVLPQLSLTVWCACLGVRMYVCDLWSKARSHPFSLPCIPITVRSVQGSDSCLSLTPVSRLLHCGALAKRYALPGTRYADVQFPSGPLPLVFERMEGLITKGWKVFCFDIGLAQAVLVEICSVPG